VGAHSIFGALSQQGQNLIKLVCSPNQPYGRLFIKSQHF